VIDTKARSSRRATRALTKASLTCAAALSAAAGVGLIGGSTASASHIAYKIDQVGYSDAVHTPNSGSRTNMVVSMNANGQVIGNEIRYDTTNPQGQTAWFFNPGPGGDGATLTRIGLFAPPYQSDHTSINNAQISTVKELNDLGYAAGESTRYMGGASANGQSAWLYFNGVTKPVGLDQGAHRAVTGGSQVSSIVKLNAQGVVVGTSQRFIGSTPSGLSAFIQTFDDTAATRIGLDVNTAGANEHRRSTDGMEFSNVQHFNDLGDAAGYTSRFATDGTGDDLGQHAWVRTADGTTRKLGYTDVTDTEHTRKGSDVDGIKDGYQTSDVLGLNSPDIIADPSAVASAIGTSQRYSATTGETLG
jgi:hypothetical protein